MEGHPFPKVEYTGKQVIPFYGRNHPFSNFFPSPVNVWGIQFTCSEQAYAFSKAWFFGDEISKRKIMLEIHPHNIKKCSRTIKNFKRKEWDEVSEGMLFEAVNAKFHQNKILAQYLLETNNMQLIEVNPFDTRWGVGITIDQLKVGKPLRGENKMGHILEKVRENLKGNKNKIPYINHKIPIPKLPVNKVMHTTPKIFFR